MPKLRRTNSSALLEKQLSRWLVQKAPWQLPEGGRETLVKLIPWLDLAILILLLPAALAVLALGSFLSGVAAGVSSGPLYWSGLFLRGAQFVLMALALPGLFKLRRDGWRFMYYGILLGIGSVLFDWFNSPAAFMSFIWALLLNVGALYLIFQVRSYYKYLSQH